MRAARAGFQMLLPRPPNGCLALAMANTPPTIGTYHAAPAGSTMARSVPVTNALPSAACASGLPRTRRQASSAASQAAMLTT